MADAELQSLLTHTADIYYLDTGEAVDGQVLEGYPDAPDLADHPCAIHQDGKILTESPVGYLIESDAIMYSEDAVIPERAKVVWQNRIFFVNGTPSRYHDYLGPTPNIPHLLEIGLRESKDQPA